LRQSHWVISDGLSITNFLSVSAASLATLLQFFVCHQLMLCALYSSAIEVVVMASLLLMMFHFQDEMFLILNIPMDHRRM